MPSQRPRLIRSPAARMSARGRSAVCVGVITGAHGVRGAVRIKSFTAEPEDVAGYGPLEDESGERRFELRLRRQRQGRADRRDLRGRGPRPRPRRCAGCGSTCRARRCRRPSEEEYYHADLIGLEAVLADGTPVGPVRAVHDFGAGDTLEIDAARRAAGDGAVHPRGRAGRRSRRRPAGGRPAAGAARPTAQRSLSGATEERA